MKEIFAKDGSKTSEGHSIVKLAESIAERGQDDPIVVRLNPTKSKEKYSVVDGFRRYEATMRNAKGDKSATIRAVVRELSDMQGDAKKVSVIKRGPKDG